MAGLTAAGCSLFEQDREPSPAPTDVPTPQLTADVQGETTPESAEGLALPRAAQYQFVALVPVSVGGARKTYRDLGCTRCSNVLADSPYQEFVLIGDRLYDERKPHAERELGIWRAICIRRRT